MRDHLDDDLLSLYAVGAATPAECLVADGHLVQCDDCRELVAELARGNREGGPSSLGDPLCGLTIGRYLLEERLGAGAHSVVYRAHDPILERKVALKLVREIDDGPLRKQLIRAAQAMARIDHRNVLAIYDAGEDGNEVFVTSAIAENGDLRTFLDSKPSVKRLLSGFAELAEGLSAVHRSGLTHRDIKPDNILVDGDANFLLADIGHTPQVGALGSVTPAYLAPEVRDGRPYAASADQYAFALTLCEVLTGVRPKNTDDAARVLRNKRVPALAIKAILRALDPEPDKRFDDAADIAIGLRPRWKSWHVVASGGAVLSAIILFATTMIGADSQPVCARSVDAAVSQWQAVRPVLAERFSTRESLWTPIDAHLSQFFVTLGTDRVVQCKAATQDQPGAHARVACLSQRAVTVGGLLAALETLPADSLPNGPGAVTLIPNVSSCSNGRPYTMPSHPPKLLTQAIQLEAEIERAKVMSRFGHYKEAIRDVSAALIEAKRLDIGGVVARAHFTLAAIAKERGNRDLARDEFEQAAELAEESGNDALRAEALSGQMVLANDETALAALARRAEAVVIRTDDPAMLAQFLSRRGVARLKRGFGAEGVDDLENARNMQLSLDGEDTAAIAQIDGNLSAGLAMVGRIEESVERRRHAVELSRIHNGTEHPAYARQLGSLGQQVDEKEGAEMLREALSVFRKNFGEAHPDTVQALSNLCVIEGKFHSPDAVTHCTEAVAAADLLHGPDAPEVAWPLTALGLELLNLDRFAEAEVALERGLRVAADPPRYPNEIADLQYYLGVSLAKQDIQLPKALSLIRAAGEVWGESPVRQALVPELDQLVEKLELAIQGK